MSAANSYNRGEIISPEEILKHLGNTYRSINRELQLNERPLDSTITAVTSLAIHENLFGQTEPTQIHLDALFKMVHLRGGLEQFEYNRFLLHKICRHVCAVSAD